MVYLISNISFNVINWPRLQSVDNWIGTIWGYYNFLGIRWFLLENGNFISVEIWVGYKCEEAREEEKVNTEHERWRADEAEKRADEAGSRVDEAEQRIAEQERIIAEREEEIAHWKALATGKK